MKSDKLQDAIGEVNDFYIQDAEKKLRERKMHGLDGLPLRHAFAC